MGDFPTKSKRTQKNTAAKVRAAKRSKPRSQRHKDVRSEIKVWLEALVRLHRETDPALGQTSEEGKFERARQAIELWWYVYAKLMLWAQSQIVGYEWARQNPKLADLVAANLGANELSVDSHLLEYIGLQYVFNRADELDPMLEKVLEELEKHGDEGKLDDPTIRCIIRELLMSRSTESSFWRFELQHALDALNYGEILDPLRPIPVKRQGSVTKARYWKLLAVAHVHFKRGQGVKKYRALEAIADALGQSVETLRDWEKSFRFDEDCIRKFESAQVAGAIESEVKSRQELWHEFGKHRHRNTPLADTANYMLEMIKSNPLDAVKRGLFEARRPTAPVAKRRNEAPENR